MAGAGTGRILAVQPSEPAAMSREGGYSDFRFQCINCTIVSIHLYNIYVYDNKNHMDTETLRRGHCGSRFMCSIARCFIRRKRVKEMHQLEQNSKPTAKIPEALQHFRHAATAHCNWLQDAKAHRRRHGGDL